MTDPTNQRIQEAKVLLRNLDEKTSSERTSQWLPAWSSLVLEKVIREIVSKPGGNVNDVYHALWDLLGAPEVVLTKIMSNFIHDVVVLCFTQYRTQHAAGDLAWMAAQIKMQCTASQAYLGLLALPESIAAECKHSLLAALEPTEFIAQARKML
jgi:hypothetical protein